MKHFNPRIRSRLSGVKIHDRSWLSVKPASFSCLRRGDGFGMLVSAHACAATVVDAVVDRHGLRAGGVTVSSPDHLAGVRRQGPGGFPERASAILPDLPCQATILAGRPVSLIAHRRTVAGLP